MNVTQGSLDQFSSTSPLLILRDAKKSWFGLPQEFSETLVLEPAHPVGPGKSFWTRWQNHDVCVLEIQSRDPEHIANVVYTTCAQHGLSRWGLCLYDQMPEWISAFVLALDFKNYAFTKYMGDDHPTRKKLFAFEELTLLREDAAALQDVMIVAESVRWARDLSNEPSNVCTPKWMADNIAHHMPKTVSLEILDENALESLGFRALLGVAKGSDNPPRVVIMRYEGALGDPVVLLGKGVCFDSGGISIKPSAGMGHMKHDMSGAASVVATMHALAASKASVHVIGIVGLVENMPDGRAQKPGDVVVSLSGKTIEINNTDAEGRLVLADLIAYAQQQWTPRCLVDLATLTGAVVIALGHEFAGLFSNDDRLSGALLAAGERSQDRLWRLPLTPAFDRLIDSKVADVDNTGPRDASSCTAAHFIQRFVKSDMPWAHLDIAGVAYSEKTGATGFGVKLLYQWLLNLQ